MNLDGKNEMQIRKMFSGFLPDHLKPKAAPAAGGMTLEEARAMVAKADAAEREAKKAKPA